LRPPGIFKGWAYFWIALAISFSPSVRLAGQTGSANTTGASAPSANSLTDAQIRDKATRLLRQMTLDEKIAQLSQLPGLPAPEFQENIKQSMEEILKQRGAGSILWISDSKEINRLQHVRSSKRGCTFRCSSGSMSSVATTRSFPAPIAMASSWDTKMVEAAQAVAAQEARAAGIQWTFAPMVDIARDARWGRMVEGAGEDPYLGAAMARAQVLGFQGKHLGPPIAC
jgi:beta-glucosidase